MASLPYRCVVASKPFRILVGANKKEFMIHADLLAHMSKPLGALVNNQMKESNEGVAEWPEVDEETFIRFCQFCYTGGYEEPTPECETKTTSSSSNSDNDYGPQHPQHPRSVFIPPHLRNKKMSAVCNIPPGVYRRLWDQFKELRYEAPSLPTVVPESPPVSRSSSAEVFLSHARLYVLADYYDIKALLELSLKRLHEVLVNSESVRPADSDIAALVEYGYQNTTDKGPDGDELRSLLAKYVACKIEILWENTQFRELLQGDGELSAAVIGQMIARLD